MIEGRAFPTPEEAALSSYSEAAHTRVIRVEVINHENVDVIIDFETSHPMRSHCMRTSEGWVEQGDIVE